MISAARGGPIVTTVTVEPGTWSFTWSAISRAFKSSGLKTVGKAARFTVPSAFMASAPTLCVSGTCLAKTTILYDIYY